MKDSAFRLQDKTMLLVGPFNGITQAIVRTMTEFGADIGFISEQQVGRYIDGVNEAREVHQNYGRAVHFNMPANTDQQIQEILGRVVGTLGRADALIDASPLSWTATTDPQTAKQTCLNLADKILPFLVAKQKGRIVYLLEDPCLDKLRGGDPVNGGGREILTAMIEEMAVKNRAQNVTVNALSVGVTDDFLLRTFPKSTSLKRSFEELQKTNPGVKLVDFNDISLSTAYLTSALSASLTGQMLRLTHGYHLPGH